jgi:hypothetical protein
MGRRDNRRSLKMRRRISQKKLKARQKRRKVANAKAPAAKPTKKKSAPKE